MKNKNNHNQHEKGAFTWKWGLAVLAAMAAVGLVLLLLGGPSRGSVLRGKAAGQNVLIITLDTMRTDHLGIYGHETAQTPNIDRFAREGVIFENCYSPVPLTLPAHCSIFTGRYPLGHGVRDNGTYFLHDQQLTLAEIMKSGGYQTYAVISSYVLLSKFGLAQGFDRYDDSLDITELEIKYGSEIPADQVYAKFHQWFFNERSVGETEEAPPFFAWVHFYDPHTPYKPPEEYVERFGTEPRQLYDGEVAYMDVYVGKVLEDLQKADLLDDTLVVMVGDHGEAFGEHEELGHSIFCYQENIRVPLIIRHPVLLEELPAGRRLRGRVNIIDIMPTVLEMVGSEPVASIQGRDQLALLAGESPKPPSPLYFESMHGNEAYGWAPLNGIIQDQHKYISLPRPELYDLSRDPDEKMNLFMRKKELAEDMDNTLQEIFRMYGPAEVADDSRREMSDADRESLQALGYISAFSGSDGDNLDPKTGILMINEFQTITQMVAQRKFEEAEEKLAAFSERFKNIPSPQYYGLRIRIAQLRHEKEEVVRRLKEAIEIFPENNEFKVRLASLYFGQNDFNTALEITEKILQQDPLFTRAYILRGNIYRNINRDIEAVENFQKALELEPHNVSLKINYARTLGQKGDVEEARRVCEELLKDESVANNPVLQSRIGIVLAEIRADDLAFDLLFKAAQTDQAEADTWNYLGIVYFRQKQYEKAIQAYRKSIEMEPMISKTHNNLGTLYLSMFLEDKSRRALLDKALQSFDQALKLSPRLLSAWNGRASVLKFSQKPRQAIREWEALVEVYPGYMNAYLNIGITYLDLKDKENALKYLTFCKDKFYYRVPPAERQRLDRLILQARQLY